MRQSARAGWVLGAWALAAAACAPTSSRPEAAGDDRPAPAVEAVERVNAFGVQVPARAAWREACAELEEAPYCDSDVECAAGELCWWGRCISAPQWSALGSLACRDFESRLDYAGDLVDVPPVFRAEYFLGLHDALWEDATAFEVDARSTGAPDLDARLVSGSGCVRLVGQTSVALLGRPDYGIALTLDRFAAGIRWMLAYTATASAQPIQPSAALTRSWAAADGCQVETTHWHFLPPSELEVSVRSEPSMRTICEWPAFDEAARARQAELLATCDGLWEAGDRGAFAATCIEVQDANARMRYRYDLLTWMDSAHAAP